MINYAFYEFDFGYLKVGYTNAVVTSVKCTHIIDAPSSPCAYSDLVFEQMQEYLNGKRKNFDFIYETHGREFQEKVWRALCDIPYGETRTYKQIAVTIGHTKAYRAVGTAINSNPLWIVIPCHRVIGTNGMLTGYAGGLPMKRRLLELEARLSESVECHGV